MYPGILPELETEQQGWNPDWFSRSQHTDAISVSVVHPKFINLSYSKVA